MEVSYYVAASIDGFIATPDGGIDWLSVVEDTNEDYGYADFLDTVDVLFMGSKTYEQTKGFGDWPYRNKKTIVFSDRSHEKVDPSVVISASTPELVVRKLENKGIKNGWLVGGASLASAFREQGLISKYIISVIPVILGSGIPLFASSCLRESLTLVGSKSYEKGLVQLTYLKSNDKDF